MQCRRARVLLVGSMPWTAPNLRAARARHLLARARGRGLVHCASRHGTTAGLKGPSRPPSGRTCPRPQRRERPTETRVVPKIALEQFIGPAAVIDVTYLLG